MNKNKGFTLIELLMVIALIGILASVILISLNSSRSKGANAAVKSNLNSVRSQAELIYDANSGDYTTVCTDAMVAKVIDKAVESGLGVGSAFSANSGSAQVITTANCNSDPYGWAVSVPLRAAEGANLYWCLDSSGVAVGKSNPLGASSVVCPAS